MSNKVVAIMRVQQPGNCQGRIIIPAHAHAVTDNAGNSYTLHSKENDLQSWSSVQHKTPTRITMTFGNGDTDTRSV